RDEVLIDEGVARHNFTNEGGAFGAIRFLKNVMGLWILESCRSEWMSAGLATGWEHLLSLAEQTTGHRNVIFPDYPSFFNPSSMLDAIAKHLSMTQQSYDSDPGSIVRTVLDSLAFRYASVVGTIESLTGGEIRGIHVVGGGSQNDYLNQMTATASGKRVLAGPIEAAAIGNALVQAITAGRFDSLASARSHVSANLSLKSFEPRPSNAVDELAFKYSEIERRYDD